MRYAILLFSLLVFAPAFAGEVAGSKAQKALSYIAALEKDPLAADGDEKRLWLMNWLMDDESYAFNPCELFEREVAQDAPNVGNLWMQRMFGNVAYQISNPGKHDEVTLQVAGMESLLRAYSAIIAKDAKAHIPYFDSLLAEQKKGTLKKRLAPIIQKSCT